jgi:hypothetical protein
MIVDLDMNSLPEILASIPNRRSRFDLVCAYVFDAFIPASEYAKNSWQRQLSPYSRLISSLDYLFIPMTASLQDFQELYQIPVAMIPIACDVKKFASNKNDERYIDVLGYGRQNQEHGKIFSEVYNHPESPRIYYHTDHMHIGKIHDFYAHRRLFWKILNHSRIALAYDVMRADPQKKFTFSFVGQRWFECLTAGCLIVGNKPKYSEMNDLFFWEDATIEIPDSSQDIIPFIEALLADKERLAAAHQRNQEKARTHHDWRHRLKQIHDCLKLPLPPQLEKDLST